MNRLYTEKDLRNAGKVGRTFVSFQFIEGRGAINECYGNQQIIMSYCVDMFAGLMARTDIQTSPEELAEEIKKYILQSYYSHTKDIKDGKEKFDTRK